MSAHNAGGTMAAVAAAGELRLTLTEASNTPTSLDEQPFTREELAAVLLDPQEGEKDGYALIPALLKECGPVCWHHGNPKKFDCGGNSPHRHRNNVTAVTAFVVDLDDITAEAMSHIIDRVQAMGVDLWVWETFSHDPKAVEEGQALGRYRMLVPFLRPLAIANPEQWSAGAWPALVRHFGVEQQRDRSCKDPSRLYFLPRKPAGEEREAAHFQGLPLDVEALLGPIDRLIPPRPIAAPVPHGDLEDPTRPVDLDEVKRRLADTRNAKVKEIAGRVVRGELVTPLPQDRKPGDTMSRHEAWWLVTGRLSIVAEDWMATDALLEVLRPSHTAERSASPEDYTPWDDDRDSVVEMLAMQRATAPTQRAEYQARRTAKEAGARNALDALMRARHGTSDLSTPTEDDEEGEPVGQAAEAERPTAWTVEEVQEHLEARHGPTGVSYLGTLKNLSLLFTMAPEWAGAFRFNNLTGEFELWPCEALGNTKVERFSDTLVTSLRLALSTNRNYPVRAAKDECMQAAEWAARQDPYEPVQDYLNSLEWDGVQRLDTAAGGWLATHMNARTEAEDGTDLRAYLSAIGKRWLISGVARAFEPGCQVDSMLQIEGAQGFRKSSALKVLGGDWYMESTTEFESKDTATLIATSFIVELGELTAFDRASTSTQKSFLARRVDSIVRKYERYRTDLPRRCIFAGTTNADDYLADTTGNRRHWAFSVESPIDLTKLRRDRDQLWAEAVHLYRQGEQWHLKPEEEATAKAEAAKRVRSEMLDDLIETWISKMAPDRRPKGVLPADIATKVLDDKKGTTRKGQITAALRRLGFVNKAMRIGGRVVKRWATPASLLDAPTESELREAIENAHAPTKAA